SPIFFENFGEEGDEKIRAEKLDEGLELLDLFMSGEKVEYQGKHYTVNGQMPFMPPVQKPRIPVWIGGKWPNKRPFRRAARWDGIMPIKEANDETGSSERFSIEEVKEMLDYITKHRDGTMDDFEFAIVKALPRDKDEANALVKEYHEAGISWWVDSVYSWKEEFDNQMEDTIAVKNRILEGPPDF
ncbi:MAG: LLM class flavin-dependent oxidoreductase, partial [Candidatus Kariarchaeaceae archaeon]